ncbi:hypothetical protein [Acetonema longum]|uniref:Uncharacterized protein n=1 Tax=Acetonema longum DSM 6540 TaxID=1009370 RepID=F7NJM7_9FIRM|nr:hypothetical protein [Acetonema longum]EGO63748.1 hypothetical protein ALO_11424 [Acetonema longum DSM 6540]
MIDTTKSFMSLISSVVNYKESVLPDSEEKVKWYPILHCNPPGLLLGVQQDGTWVVEVESGLYRLSNSGSFWRLVSLLEQPSNEIRKEVANSFNSLDIKIDIDDFFPFAEIVRAGLQFGTKYWAEMASDGMTNCHLKRKSI